MIKTYIQLVVELKSLIRKEHEIGLEIVELLKLVEKKREYLQRGYSSLYEFCIKELGMSDSQAYTRVTVLKALDRDATLITPFKTGELKPTQICEAVRTFKKVSVITDEKVTLREQSEIFDSLKGKTREETKKILKEKFSDVLPQTEKIILELTPEILEKLKSFKATHSHKLKTHTHEEALELLLEMTSPKPEKPTTQKSPKENLTVTSQSDNNSAEKKINSRYIQADIKRQLFKIAENQCQYIDPETGRRCTCKHHLQVEHKIPFSQGGSSADIDNLEILCANHNQMMWRDNL